MDNYPHSTWWHLPPCQQAVRRKGKLRCPVFQNKVSFLACPDADWVNGQIVRAKVASLDPTSGKILAEIVGRLSFADFTFSRSFVLVRNDADLSKPGRSQPFRS
jgi:hypothetical protein